MFLSSLCLPEQYYACVHVCICMHVTHIKFSILLRDARLSQRKLPPVYLTYGALQFSCGISTNSHLLQRKVPLKRNIGSSILTCILQLYIIIIIIIIVIIIFLILTMGISCYWKKKYRHKKSQTCKTNKGVTISITKLLFALQNGTNLNPKNLDNI